MQVKIKSFLTRGEVITFEDKTHLSSGTIIGHTFSLENCPECLGKNELSSLDCGICFSTKHFLVSTINQIKIDDESKQTDFPYFEKQTDQNQFLSEVLTQEEKDLLGIYSDKLLPGTLGGDNGSSKAGGGDEDQGKIKWLHWLFKLLLFLAFLWLLLQGLEFIKNDNIEKKEKVEEVSDIKKKTPEPKTAPKSKGKDKQPPRKGSGGDQYLFDPLIVWKNYGNMNYLSLSSNRSLQNFISKKLKRGSLKENRKLMSEKGIFHVCADFGKYAKDCRDQWFENRKVRQTFVDRLEQIYKEEGESLYE